MGDFTVAAGKHRCQSCSLQMTSIADMMYSICVWHTHTNNTCRHILTLTGTFVAITWRIKLQGHSEERVYTSANSKTILNAHDPAIRSDLIDPLILTIMSFTIPDNPENVIKICPYCSEYSCLQTSRQTHQTVNWTTKHDVDFYAVRGCVIVI